MKRDEGSVEDAVSAQNPEEQNASSAASPQPRTPRGRIICDYRLLNQNQLQAVQEIALRKASLIHDVNFFKFLLHKGVEWRQLV